jgi:protein-S-isoprenylcysteine O-methyltransferase Ste14
MFIFFNASALSLIIGFVVAIIGELIRYWGVSWAGSETRTTTGVGGSNLIISGPFAHVRNPLYIGNILMYLGLGIMSYALFPYLQVVAILFFLFQYYLIVGEEEEFLNKKFGTNYEIYKNNVPSFFPRISVYHNESLIQPKVDFKKGLKSETRTLQAFFLISLAMLILWLIKNKLN